MEKNKNKVINTTCSLGLGEKDICNNKIDLTLNLSLQPRGDKITTIWIAEVCFFYKHLLYKHHKKHLSKERDAVKFSFLLIKRRNATLKSIYRATAITGKETEKMTKKSPFCAHTSVTYHICQSDTT
jgi:hypothetical protein